MTTEVLEAPVATPAEMLRNAARYIEEHGWSQGQFRNYGGNVCVLGAIVSVSGEPTAWGQQSTAAAALLQDYLGVPSVSVVAIWNDRPERTRDEVLAALRAAAEKGDQ